MHKKVFLSLGSNIPSRIHNINMAVRLLSEKGKITNSSFLYETSPMYNTNQNSFLNAVIKFETKLEPIELLSFTQSIEKKLGREKSNIYKGPRTLDIDILFYENSCINMENLLIPHPLIQERDFVLKPLIDIDENFKHPTLNKSIKELYQENEKNRNLSHPTQIFGIGSEPSKEKIFDFNKETYTMGIINLTPDSFYHHYLNKEDISHMNDNNVYPNILDDMLKKQDGFDIYDIGGESTRPNAETISAQEEINRVEPLLKLIRENEKAKDLIISIDTRKGTVINNFIINNYPFDIINDVTSGRFSNNETINLACKYNYPFIFMHSRGEPKTMNSLTQYHDVLNEIWNELNEKINYAIENGLPRWNIIVDPGFGFSKENEANLIILKNMRFFKESKFPLLVGYSNKRLVKNFFQNDLIVGNSILGAVCVEKGADMIRIHDYEVAKGIKFASKVYKENN